MRIREVAVDEVLEEGAKAVGANGGSLKFVEESALGGQLEVYVAVLRKGAEGRFGSGKGGGGGGRRRELELFCDGRVVVVAAAHCLRRDWNSLHFTCPRH